MRRHRHRQRVVARTLVSLKSSRSFYRIQIRSTVLHPLIRYQRGVGEAPPEHPVEVAERGHRLRQRSRVSDGRGIPVAAPIQSELPRLGCVVLREVDILALDIERTR